MVFEEDAKSLNFEAVAVSLIVSAFGFVAALFWKDAIQSLIDEIVPQGQGVVYQFYAAIIVTVIAVLAVYILTRYITRIDDKVKETIERRAVERRKATKNQPNNEDEKE